MTHTFMKLKIITPELIKNKTVLLKVDFNVPLKNENGEIKVAEDTRIQSTIPTIKMLQDNNCKIIIVSHAGRPNGQIVEGLRLIPMAKHLSKLIGNEVETSAVLTGSEVLQKISKMSPKSILMLENTRFDKREKTNDESLAKELASYADVFVNESFSSAHRDHTTVSGIPKFLPSFAGLAFQAEFKMLTKLMDKPKKPFVAIVGGAKISGKIDAIRNLTKIADVVLVGGGVANNFIKAQGIDVCNSYLEDCVIAEKTKNNTSFVEVAFDLMNDNKVEKMLLNGYIPLPKIIYPSDVLAADSIDNPTNISTINLTEENNGSLKKNMMFLDIGPKTQRLYRDIILQAGTIFWNGPMGVFEKDDFSDGTAAVASAVAKTSAMTTVGGGDTLSAISHFNLKGRFDNVSASGGAALELLTGKILPGLEPLKL